MTAHEKGYMLALAPRCSVDHMKTSDDIRLLYCTCPDADTAQRIARAVVESGQAACVNIIPGLRSVYRWQGTLQEDSEYLLLIKTQAARLVSLTESILSLHPYELPEVIAVPVVAGHAPYLDWVRDSTT
jgi:periplasmic divalent cation tolerance protein